MIVKFSYLIINYYFKRMSMNKTLGSSGKAGDKSDDANQHPKPKIV